MKKRRIREIITQKVPDWESAEHSFNPVMAESKPPPAREYSSVAEGAEVLEAGPGLPGSCNVSSVKHQFILEGT